MSIRILLVDDHHIFREGLRSLLASQPDFTIPSDDWVHVVRICQLVQGLPLGIELAAAWAKVLSCQEIATEIAIVIANC